MAFVNSQILSGDNVNEGRIKINSGWDDNIYWTEGTGVDAIVNQGFSSALSANSISFAISLFSSSQGVNSHIEGSLTVASGNSSHSQNYRTTAAGDYSHAGGKGLVNTFNHRGVTAGGDCSFAHGSRGSSGIAYEIGALADYSAVLGGRANSVSVNSKKSGIFCGQTDYPTEGDRISNTIDPIDACNVIIGGFRTKIIDCQNSSIIGGSHSTMENNVPVLNVMNCSSIIGGGYFNMYNSGGSIILGGGDSLESLTPVVTTMSASTTSSILGGGFYGALTSELTAGKNSSIIAGISNYIGHPRAGSLGPGQTLPPVPIMSGYIAENSVIVGGFFNQMSYYPPGPNNKELFIVGGSYNLVQGGKGSGIIGGRGNYLYESFGGTNEYSTIIGGQYNTLTYRGVINSVIVGGYRNVIGATTGGAENCVVMGTGIPNYTGNCWTLGYNGTAPASSVDTAIKILFNFEHGAAYWDGNPDLAPADYSEYFEWDDGNVSNEDRAGYFASLIGEKVEIGNSNTVGIVSANPAIVGDSAELKWQQIYERDEWGRKLYDLYTIYDLEIAGSVENKIYIDENDIIYLDPPNPANMSGTLYGGDTSQKVFVEHKNIHKINPSYDKNQNYTPRKDRKEWSPIGMLGKLNVRTSETITGTTISADSNGMAVNGNDYHVLESKKSYDGNYGVVKILFK